MFGIIQAIAHFIPCIGRSLRNTEFCESQNEEGHQNFRATLPIEQATHVFIRQQMVGWAAL
jgi:hypothetical protein